MELNDSKAPGLDGIGAEIWQCNTALVAKKVYPLVLKAAIRKQHIVEWTGGWIFPLHKGKTAPSQMAGYRAILLEPSIARAISKSWRKELGNPMPKPCAVHLELHLSIFNRHFTPSSSHFLRDLTELLILLHLFSKNCNCLRLHSRVFCRTLEAQTLFIRQQDRSMWKAMWRQVSVTRGSQYQERRICEHLGLALGQVTHVQICCSV